MHLLIMAASYIITGWFLDWAFEPAEELNPAAPAEESQN